MLDRGPDVAPQSLALCASEDIACLPVKTEWHLILPSLFWSRLLLLSARSVLHLHLFSSCNAMRGSLTSQSSLPLQNGLTQPCQLLLFELQGLLPVSVLGDQC